MFSSAFNIEVCCLFSLVFWTFAPRQGQSKCTSLEVSGSLYHSNIDGIYLLDGKISCNSRHMWVQESGDHYLYYVLDGYDGWTVGLWPCHWGDFSVSVKSTVEQPFDIPDVWKEYVEEASTWKNNSQFRVRCTDDTKYKTEVTSCQMVLCQNGASCKETDGTFECYCQRGYYGRFCETAINVSHCKSSPCLNGASCSDLINDFQCKCTPGHAGRQCDILTDDVDCDLWPCHEKCIFTGKTPCFSQTYLILMIVGVLGAVIILILVIFYVMQCVYSKKCHKVQDTSSSVDDFHSWKDLSYKRLESLDSVQTLDRVGV